MMLLAAAGCATVPPPPTVERVDVPRFMGDWYVQGGILTWFERDAYNAVENYRLAEDGSSPTTYTLNRGALDGPRKTFHSTAWVHDKESGAEWRVQFFWPFKFPYLIVHLEPDYSLTAISTEDRGYLWIMSRAPHVPEEQYARLIARLDELGFDTNAFVRVRHAPAQAGQTR